MLLLSCYVAAETTCALPRLYCCWFRLSAGALHTVVKVQALAMCAGLLCVLLCVMLPRSFAMLLLGAQLTQQHAYTGWWVGLMLARGIWCLG
jgi:hypothetical protein